MPPIERITPSEAKRKLASVLNSVEFGQKPVILERHGREIAALIPIELYAVVRDLLQHLEDEQDWSEIRRALADPVNATPLAWEPERCGKVVSNPDSPNRRQKPAARPRGAAAKDSRRHRRARR